MDRALCMGRWLRVPGAGATGPNVLALAQPLALIKHGRPQTSLGLGE